jgi:hypothetical protein
MIYTFPKSEARAALAAQVAAWTGLTDWYRANRVGTYYSYTRHAS